VKEPPSLVLPSKFPTATTNRNRLRNGIIQRYTDIEPPAGLGTVVKEASDGIDVLLERAVLGSPDPRLVEGLDRVVETGDCVTGPDLDERDYDVGSAVPGEGLSGDCALGL
jgi:hypothetical protein